MILIEGKKIAAELRDQLKKEVADLKVKTKKVPGLTVILIGELAPSKIYVKMKEKAAVEVGIKSEIIRYPESVEEKTVLEKIDELTPHSNQNNKRFYTKKTKSLESTKKYFKETQSLTGVELKEFSLLYLVINNLDLLQANIHLIENIKLFTEFNRKIFEMIIEKLKSGTQITIQDLNLDNQLTEKINKFAPIKHILKNQSYDDQKIIELLEDISRDLMNYDLEYRIQELESKFSVDMSETTFNELKELKKKQNLN